MTRTQSEDTILRYIYDRSNDGVNDVLGPMEYLRQIAERDDWKLDPDMIDIDGLNKEEFEALWEGMADQYLIRRSDGIVPYWYVSELGTERLCLPGTKAKQVKDAEFKAVYETPHRAEYMVRNQVLTGLTDALTDIAKATGYAGIRLKEPLYEIAHALNRIADAMDDENAHLHRKGAAQRSGQRKSHAQSVREIDEKASALDRRIHAKTNPPFEMPNPGPPIKKGKK